MTNPATDYRTESEKRQDELTGCAKDGCIAFVLVVVFILLVLLGGSGCAGPDTIELRPGEAALISPDGEIERVPGGEAATWDRCASCSFAWPAEYLAHGRCPFCQE